MGKINAGMMSSNTDMWSTPQGFFDKLNAEFDFDWDVCADLSNAKCEHWFDRRQNGLDQNWKDHFSGPAWMNPPYGKKIGEWIKKAAESGLVVVALLPARTDTKWFHDYILGKVEIRFIKGRLKFGGCKNSAPFPSMIAIWRPK